MESRSKSFPTKRGHCHIYPDRIEIEDKGVWGKFMTFLYNRGIKNFWLIRVILIILSMLSVLIALWIKNYFLALFLGVMAMYALWEAWSRRKISQVPILQKEQIESIIYQEPVQGLSRPSFLIQFKTERGRLKQRIITLPGIGNEGEMVAQSAFYMLKETGLPIEKPGG